MQSALTINFKLLPSFQHHYLVLNATWYFNDLQAASNRHVLWPYALSVAHLCWIHFKSQSFTVAVSLLSAPVMRAFVATIQPGSNGN